MDDLELELRRETNKHNNIMSKLDADIEELIDKKKKAEKSREDTKHAHEALKQDREDTEDAYIRLKETNNRASLQYASLNEEVSKMRD